MLKKGEKKHDNVLKHETKMVTASWLMERVPGLQSNQANRLMRAAVREQGGGDDKEQPAAPVSTTNPRNPRHLDSIEGRRNSLSDGQTT